MCTPDIFPLPAEQSHQLALFLCSHHPYLCATVQKKKKKKTGAFMILHSYVHLCWFLTLLRVIQQDPGKTHQPHSSISSLHSTPLFTGQKETSVALWARPSLAIFPTTVQLSK